MANTVDDALEYNKGALTIVWAQLSGATVPSSPRNDLVWAYVLIAIKHHEGIHTLASQNLMAPASALLRSQIETAYRGLWVNLIATDEQVKTIRENDAEPFPRFRQMAADLDTSYRAGGWLQSFADHWGVLNGYTHSGLLQLSRQFRDEHTLDPNYPAEMVIYLLVTSGTTSIGCIVPIFRHMGLHDKAAALEQWLDEHPFYRQTKEAALPAEDAPKA
jgi:hypothetical protein